MKLGKRLRLWFWWICNGRDRLDMVFSRVEGLERLCSKQQAQLSEQKELIKGICSEFNTLRNNLPAVLTNPPKQSAGSVRHMGSWRATVAALEARPQPIPIERTS